MVQAVLCDIDGRFPLRAKEAGVKIALSTSANREGLPTCKRISNMGFEQSALPGKAQ